MDAKINLGIFEFDSERLLTEMGDVKSAIDQTSVALKEARAESTSYAKRISDLSKVMAILEKDEKTNTEAYKTAQAEVKKLKDDHAKLADAIVLMEGHRKDLTQEYRDGTKVLQAFAKVQDINLDNYTTEGKSIRELRRESQALTTLRNELKTSVGEESEELKKLNAIIEENTQAQKENVNENQKRFYQIGQYKEELGGALSEIKNSIDALRKGDFMAFSTGVQAGFKGMTASARAFFVALMANPVTALVVTLGALLTATGLVIKEFWDYNQAIRPMIKSTEQITKLQGAQADSARTMAQAYSETFGGEFDENLKTASELVTDFGISYEEAFDMMAKGLAKGADVNGEFQDSIREYGGLFADAGYTAQEFVDILNAGADLGIYSDKLPDAIKEAQLSINEQTKATKDALVGAFGQSFTDDLLNRVNTGQTKIKDALQEIAEEAEKSNLSQQQLATLTADIFRGAGEDAGGAQKVFEALRYSVEEVKRPLSELEQATYDVAKANEELMEAKDKALKSDSILAFQGEFEMAWIKIKTGWYEFVDSLFSGLKAIEKAVQGSAGYVRGAITSIPDVAIKSFKSIKDSFAGLVEALLNGWSAIKKASSLDFTGAVSDLKALKSGVVDFGSNIKDVYSNAFKDVGKAGAEEMDKALERLEAKNRAYAERAKETAKKAENESSGGSITDSSGGGTTKAVKEAKNKVDKAKEDALKIIQEINNELVKQSEISANMVRMDLTEWIANNTSKIGDNKRVTASMLEEENIRLDNLLNKQREALEAEKASRELRLQSEIDLLNLKDNLSDSELIKLENLESEKLLLKREYAEKERAQTEAINQEREEAQRMREAQIREDEKLRKTLEFEEELLRLEEEDAIRFELERERARQHREQSLADLEESYSDGLISLENYETKKQLIIDNSERAITAIEEREKSARMSQTEAVLGGITELMGKNTAMGKASGIAQATINMHQGVTEALSAKSVLPSPFDVVAKIANIALIVKNGMRAIGAIKSTKVPKAQRGMVTRGASHDMGGIPAIVGGSSVIELEGGEAIINKKSTAMFLPQLSKINEIGGGVKFANGGVAPSELNVVQGNVSGGAGLELAGVIEEAVARGAMLGTYNGSQNGMKDLSTNNLISRGASHG